MLQRGAKLLTKSWRLWLGCTSVTDRRQTDRQTELRWHKASERNKDVRLKILQTLLRTAGLLHKHNVFRVSLRTRSNCVDNMITVFGPSCRVVSLTVYIQKKELKGFATYLLFIYEHLLKYWSSVHGESSCCNGTFTDVLFTSLLKLRIFNEETNYFQICRFSIHSAILSEMFIQIGWYL